MMQQDNRRAIGTGTTGKCAAPTAGGGAGSRGGGHRQAVHWAGGLSHHRHEDHPECPSRGHLAPGQAECAGPARLQASQVYGLLRSACTFQVSLLCPGQHAVPRSAYCAQVSMLCPGQHAVPRSACCAQVSMLCRGQPVVPRSACCASGQAAVPQVNLLCPRSTCCSQVSMVWRQHAQAGRLFWHQHAQHGLVKINGD